jgi:hypothetical protein
MRQICTVANVPPAHCAAVVNSGGDPSRESKNHESAKPQFFRAISVFGVHDYEGKAGLAAARALNMTTKTENGLRCQPYFNLRFYPTSRKIRPAQKCRSSLCRIAFLPKWHCTIKLHAQR